MMKIPMHINYRQIYQNKDGKRKEEKRPHFNMTVKWKWGSIKFSDRNRFEYRIFEDQDNVWRYRNGLKISLPSFKKGDCEITPFVIDEIFIDMDTGEFSRNRLYLGFETELTENLYGEILYLRQSTKQEGNWSDINAISIKLILNF